VVTMSLPAQLVRTGCFERGVPGQFTVTGDGAAVLFVRSRAGNDPTSCLWALDLDSGTERVLADPGELLGAGAGECGGVAGYATDAAATLAAFTLAGELWTVNVGDGQVRRLSAQCPLSDPRPDPPGARIAYIRAGELRLIEVDGTVRSR
jgi:dipeptidyl-peptidase 4